MGGGSSKGAPGVTARGRTISSFGRMRDRRGGLVTNIERARANYRRMDAAANAREPGSAAANRRARRARRKPSNR